MSRKLLLTSVIVVLLAVLAIVSGVATAQEPTPPGVILSYSSTLADPAGNAVADGNYDFIFTLYASEKDTQPLWTETQTGVLVKSGNLDIGLGQNIAIPKEVAGLKDLWVEISVRGPQDSDFILLNPRQNLNTPDAVSALTCPHSHFTDSWSGSNPEWGLLLDNSSTGDGLRAYSKATQWNYAAVFGANTATTGSGTGVYGFSEKGLGMRAESRGSDGLEAVTNISNKSAVYAHSENGYGVTGRSISNFGVQAGGGGDGSGTDLMGDLFLEGARGEVFTSGDRLYLYSNGWISFFLDNDNNGSNTLEVFNGANNLVFTVDESGNTVAAGTKSAEVKTTSYGTRLVYAVESSEVWFEEIGTAYLADGAVMVNFDPIFAETVNLNVDYHVTVTPICEEAVLLFVSAKTVDGFTVQGVTMSNQPSSCAFDYRVSAKRLGYEDSRLASTDMTMNSRDQR